MQYYTCLSYFPTATRKPNLDIKILEFLYFQFFSFIVVSYSGLISRGENFEVLADFT